MLSTKNLMLATLATGLMLGAPSCGERGYSYGGKAGKPKKQRSKHKAKIAFTSKRKNR